MKLAKKSLSVFLSLLMVFSTCSVCLSGLSFSASAASSYTVDEVKSLVSAAASSAATVESADNEWNFTGDNGAVLAAADAIYDYAVNGVKGSGSTAANNSSDTLYNTVRSNLGFSEGSNEAKLIKSILYANGVKAYGYENKVPLTGNFEDTTSLSNGADVSGNSKVSYSEDVKNSVAYTASVTIDVNKYLLTVDNVGKIPTSFPTKIVYNFSNTYGTSASQTSQDSDDRTSGCTTTTYYTHYWTSYKWNFLSSYDRSVYSTNTTAKTDWQTYAAYFTDARLATTAADMLNLSLGEIDDIYNEAFALSEAMSSKYSPAVIDKFIGVEEINNYLKEVNYAAEVVRAQAYMEVLLNAMDKGYNSADRAEMEGIYPTVKDAYDIIKDYEQSIFDYVIENNSAFSAFTIEKAKAFIDTLHFDIEVTYVKDIKAAVDAEIQENAPKVADPENKDDITDIELAAIIDRLNGYKDAMAQYSAAANDAVFTEGKDYIADFRGDVNLKINTRAAQVEYEPFYEYFIPIVFDSPAFWSSSEMHDKYEAAEDEYNSLNYSYSKWTATLGETLAKSVFSFYKDGVKILLPSAVNDYMTSIKNAIINKVNGQLEEIQHYADLSAEVNFENFSGLKAGFDNFNEPAYYVQTGTDEEGNPIMEARTLYDYAHGVKGWIDAAHIALYNNVAALMTAYDAFVASGGIPFDQKHYHDTTTGIFTTRYAGDQGLDADGNQIGFPNDIARDGAAENYDVTEQKVNDTITKLDRFITSEDFCTLVGLENELTGEVYPTLTAAIQGLIHDNLFTDEMMNTIVAALFPMLVDLIGSMLGDLSSLGQEGITQGPEGTIGRLDLTTMTGGDFTGTVDIYADGEGGAAYFADAFADLKLYIYPEKLATKLSAYPEIASALTAAGRDWNYFSKPVEDAEPDENGEIPEEIVLDFDWGIDGDETKFKNAIGAIFDSILPLLNTVLFGKEYNETAQKLAYARNNGNMVYDWTFDLTITELKAYVNVNITIGALTAFKDVFVPLFEALGLTEHGYNIVIPSGDNIKGSDISNAILNPIIELINELSASPINKVLEVLPNLMYALSMDRVAELINTLNIDLGVAFKVNSIESLKLSGIQLDWLADLLKSTIEGLLPAINETLALGELLDLQEMLGFDYRNINALMAFVLDLVGLDVSLPTINVGEIILCSKGVNNAASLRTGGKRVHLTADKADILFLILRYVTNAIGDIDFVNSIIKFIQESSAEEGEDPDSLELPAIVYNIIGTVGANPLAALAAIVELINPQAYAADTYDWFESDYTYEGIEGATDASIVYVSYRNDWTKEKANHLVDNIDAILESVLTMMGESETSINDILKEAIAELFLNENITGLAEGLVSLGTLIDADNIVALVDKELGVNLKAWFNAFGYLFPSEDPEAPVAPAPGEEGYAALGGITVTTAPGVDETTGEPITVYTWALDGVELVDGDREVWLDIFCELIAELTPVISLLLKGDDLGLFNDAITFLGYENYASTVGVLFEMLNIEDVMTQDEYVAYCNANGDEQAFNFLTQQLFDKFDELLDGNIVKNLLSLVPNIIYFIESNGLSTLLHNLLMPVLVIVDTVRSIFDVDINAVLSLIVSDLLNYGELNTDVLLEFLSGVYMNDDPEYKWLSIDINNLNLTEILKLVDTFLGTKLADSQLVNPGLNALCSGRVAYPSVTGTAYKPTVDTADTITIFVSALLEALQYEVSEGVTNADVVAEFIEGMLDEPKDVKGILNSVIGLIQGLEISYEIPDWFYMFDVKPAGAEKVVLPEKSIVYLGYNTDWTSEAADKVDAALNDIIKMILNEAADGQTIAQLLNGILNDEVYTDANLQAIVERLVNLIADLDETLRDTIDAVVDTKIADWFAMCEVDAVTGEYVCTKTWGVDEAEDKKAVFVAALKEVLAPANELLAFLLFADDYTFFTGTEKNEDGSYKYNDIITLSGGEGYAYGLVPILEALGCTMKPASTYFVPATDTQKAHYDVPQAVSDILDSVLKLVDDISGDPATSVFGLIANLIYFINADGVKVSVNNILAPIDGLVEMLSPLISEDGEDVTLGSLIAGELGFDLSNLTMDTLLGIAGDAGFNMSPEMYEILRTFYIGDLTQFVSVNGEYAYRMTFDAQADNKSQADMLTIVLSFAIDAFKLNGELFGDLLGQETYDAVVALIAGAQKEFTYADPNWAYMYEGEDALAQLLANGLPARTEENSIVYTQYTNYWNFATADYLSSNLGTIIKGITDAVRNDGSTVGTILDAAITDKLYQDSILNSLLEAVVKLLADLDYTLVEAVGAVLDADIDTWFSWCEITRDAEGKVTDVTCTKDWGIDAQPTNELKKAAFVKAFVTALEPANRVLAFLLFGGEYTFLEGTTGTPLITLKGGNGYAEAFIPLLEALGCEMKPASAYYTDGVLDMSAAVKDVFTQLVGWLTAICGDLNDLENGEGAVEAMLDKLINIVYFINADGAKAVVNNLLQPVNFVLDSLAPVLGEEINLDELIGFPITDLDFYAIFDIVEDKVPLYFPDEVQNFIANIYLGDVEDFESANGKTAFRMVYTEEESRREMITILLSIVLESAQDPRNEGKLSDWLGSDAYKAIMDLLKIKEAKEMKEYTWLFTEDAGTDKVYSAIESSGRYEATYNENWTPEKAQYLADNFEPFIGNVLHLASPTIEGQKVTNLEQAIEALVSGNLYTQANADAIIDALAGVMADLMAMEPYGEYIENIALAMFGIDVHTWDNMTVTVTDGDRASFQAALTQILAPATPFLELLLVGKDVKLFYELNGEDTVVIPGSEGYAYGIIPLFEALGCNTLLTPAEYKTKIEEDPANAVNYLLNPLFDRIDAIQADPVNQIFEMLPAVIYFINCGGLDTSVKNIINTVDTVLEALAPVIGASSLLDLLDIEIEGEKLDLATINFDFIFDLLVDMLEEKSGLEVRSFAADAVAELTTGKVVPYTSANGKTYYTMEYASPENKADMATAMLRLILDFATTDNNVEVFKALLADVITDEGSYNSICSVLDSLAQSAQEDPDMGNAIYAVYYVFVAAAEAAEGTDDLYHDVNNSWQFILKLLTDSNEPVLNQFGNSLKDTLNEYFDGIFDDEGVASDGALTFFERLKAFFQRIADWFRKLFGMA